jgi:hypothetical protein
MQRGELTMERQTSPSTPWKPYMEQTSLTTPRAEPTPTAALGTPGPLRRRWSYAEGASRHKDATPTVKLRRGPGWLAGRGRRYADSRDIWPSA